MLGGKPGDYDYVVEIKDLTIQYVLVCDDSGVIFDGDVPAFGEWCQDRW
jgi:hypothetical protein